MRRKKIPYTIIITLLVLGGVFFAVRTLQRHSSEKQDKPFLETIHELQEQTPLSEGVGAAPPLDADQTQVPVLEVVAEIDLGEVPNDRLSRHTLSLKNAGKEPLELTEVQSNCACTRGRIPDNGDWIAPGQTGTIEITVDPHRIPGFYSSKILSIFSNDPQEPMTDVTVIAHIDPEFEIVPQEVDFGEVAKGTVVTKTQHIRQLVDDPLEITEVKEHLAVLPNQHLADLDFLLEEVPPAQWKIPGKREYTVIITLNPIMPAGAFTRKYEVVSNVQRMPWFRGTIKGSIAAPYHISPTFPHKLSLLPLDPKQPHNKVGTVLLSAQSAIEIADLALEHPLFEIQITPNTPALEKKIEFSLREIAPSGRVLETIPFFVQVGEESYPERVVVSAIQR